MGQQEIMDFLKNNKKSWYFSKDISKKTGSCPSATIRSLSKLRAGNYIKFKKIKVGQHMKYIYKSK